MKLKVLIADDEEKVCKLINCLIDWDSIGLEVTGIVHNGMDALLFIAENHPNIIITDIRMPNVNGLEMISQAKQIDENLDFIIISGHNHFEYAQKAIKYGVQDYILKPIKEKELLASLKKLVEKHEALLAQQEETITLKEQLHSDMDKTRASFFHEIIKNRGEESLDGDLEQINANYYFNFGAPRYLVMMIQPIIFERLKDEQLLAFFTGKTRHFITSAFSGFRETAVHNQGETFYCLFNGTKQNMDYLRATLRDLRNSLKGIWETYARTKLFLSISLDHEGISSIPQCMREAIHASYDKLVTYHSILEYRQVNGGIEPDSFISGSFRKDFLTAIETLNDDQIAKLIGTLAKELQTSVKSGQTIRDVFFELLGLFEFGVKSYHHNIDHKRITEQLVEDFDYYLNLSELLSALLSEIQKSFSEYKLEKSQEIIRPIRLAKQYIKTNYAKPLTLEILGNEVGLHPAYFSSVFKRETGSSFIDYLNEVRIENAKQLLLKRSYSLTYVSEAVGFNDIKYFKKRFKKSTGLNPTEYCKLYS